MTLSLLVRQSYYYGTADSGIVSVLSACILEQLNKMALGGKGKRSGNAPAGIIRITQQIFCLLHFLHENIIMNGAAHLLLKEFGKITGMQL